MMLDKKISRYFVDSYIKQTKYIYTLRQQRYNMKRTTNNKKKQFFTKYKEYLDIFKNIPYGTSRIVKNLLIEKYGIKESYSLNYINMCLNPDDKRFNKRVMNMAIIHFALERKEEENLDNKLAEIGA